MNQLLPDVHQQKVWQRGMPSESIKSVERIYVLPVRLEGHLGDRGVGGNAAITSL